MFQLKEYIEKIYQLEKIKLEQEYIVHEIDKQIDDVSFDIKRYRDAEIKTVEPLRNIKDLKSLFSGFWILIIFAIVILIIKNSGLDFLIEDLFAIAEIDRRFINFFLLVLPPLCFLCSIYIAWNGFVSLKKMNREIREDNNQICLYNEQARKQNEMNAGKRSECKRKILYLEETKKGVIDKYDKTNEILNQFYALNVIFPKYRDICAISSIYEYLVSGRCYELQGHEGAYNLYEQELRMGTIINQLNKIVDNLEEIKQNQHTLYYAMKDANEISRRMIQQIKKEEDSLIRLAESNERLVACNAVIAYNTRRAKEELEYQNWLRINHI